MCTTRDERRLIGTRCQKEYDESKLDGQTVSPSDYSAHLWVVQNFDTSPKMFLLLINLDLLIFQINIKFCDFWLFSTF